MFLGSFFLSFGGKKNHEIFGGKKIVFSEAPNFGFQKNGSFLTSPPIFKIFFLTRFLHSHFTL